MNYQQALSVICWLGEGDEHSGYAIDRMADPAFRASCSELETTASKVPTADMIRVRVILVKNLERGATGEGPGFCKRVLLQ